MQAFVTGSTGLLGNNLVRLLIEQGYNRKSSTAFWQFRLIISCRRYAQY